MTQAITAGVVLPSQRAIEAILKEMIERFGGSYGARDLATVVAALSRAATVAVDGPSPVHRGAAAIGCVMARTAMPTIAVRNLRAAWITMFVTLRLNGWYLDARESDATAVVRGIADASVDEAALTAFLEANSRQVSA